MTHKLKASIFVQILLATLLPLILIFSLVIATITKSFFQSSAAAAQRETLFSARRVAEQVRSCFLHNTVLTELAAKDLALVAADSDSARETALNILRNTLEKAPSAYRIRMYFAPGEGAFGAKESFAHIYYNENNMITGHRLVPGEEMDSDIASPWYNIPLEHGTPYQDSVAYGRFGPDKESMYVASTNFPVIKNGVVIGCVGMDVLYRQTLQFIDEWNVNGSYRMLLSGEDGTILSASNHDMVGRNINDLRFYGTSLEKMKNAMEQNIYFMGESQSPVVMQKSLIAMYPIDLPNATSRIFMYIDTPVKLVYSEANASVRVALLTFLGGLLLFVGSLFTATRSITNPIKKLTATADLIAHDQFDVAQYNFDEKYVIRNEVSSLRDSLRAMLKKIEEGHRLKIVAMETEYEKKRLEAASADKDRFFANMSHEIRTPMNVIYGMTEMLLLENLTAGQKKYAQDIKVSAENLLGIINDILDLSRLESRELPLLPRHYFFNALVENVCSLCQYLTQKKHLLFHYETTGDIPTVLYGDDGRLRQVLLNILENAIKFTEQGSITLSILAEDDALCFVVSDTGIGVKGEDMHYLFEPFKRLDGQMNQHIHGSGLGLSISNSLVKLMGGSIIVNSEYGKGSTFRITIPKTPGDAAKIKTIPTMLPITFTSDVRVLVVDDSASNLRVAVEFLKKFNVTVDTAASGAACLEMLNKVHYNMVFMDHMMPEMDGIETTARIRALGGLFAKLPIVVLTANAVVGAREMFLAAGMDDFLAKPIEKTKLQAVLTKWLPENSEVREFFYDPRSAQAMKNERGLSDLLLRATHLKELDIPLGLIRVADNHKLYEDLLGMILEVIPNTLGKIDAALQKGDTGTLIIETHLLKGSLANLGATDLSALAAELERVGYNGDMATFTDKLGPFRAALEEFTGKLQGIFTKNESDARVPSPEKRGELEGGLCELREALASFNYEKSREIISNLMRFDWGEEWNNGLEALFTHIKYFDYEAAMGALNSYFPNVKG